MEDKEASDFYLGKRIAYIYKVRESDKVLQNGRTDQGCSLLSRGKSCNSTSQQCVAQTGLHSKRVPLLLLRSPRSIAIFFKTRTCRK